MRDLPIVAKTIINVLLYILYVVIFLFIFWLILAVFTYYFSESSLSPSSPIFINLTYFIAVLVLLISLILRKYFYIWAARREVTLKVESNNYTAKKKPSKAKKTIKTKLVDDKIVEESDDEIKIYVEKEIK